MDPRSTDGTSVRGLGKTSVDGTPAELHGPDSVRSLAACSPLLRRSRAAGGRSRQQQAGAADLYADRTIDSSWGTDGISSGGISGTHAVTGGVGGSLVGGMMRDEEGGMRRREEEKQEKESELQHPQWHSQQHPTGHQSVEAGGFSATHTSAINTISPQHRNRSGVVRPVEQQQQHADN